MIQSIPFSTQSQNAKNTNNFSRILSAAVISQSFRRKLLSDPARAVNSGYNQEKFHLTREELARISAIRAGSLAEFALHLARN